MSFGFSASDFVICIQLAYKVWRECRDAPDNFRTVSTEVASLQLVLKEVQETVNDHEPSQSKQDDLKKLVEGCSNVLEELEELLKKYKSLGTQSKRAWDRFGWGKEHIENIRQRVISTTSLLTSFNIGLIGSGVARVEKLLQQLMLEHQLGQRESSVISTSSLTSAEEGDEAIWSQIGRELEDVGITSGMVHEYRGFIITWIKNALETHQFDEISSYSDLGVSPLAMEAGSRFEESNYKVARVEGSRLGYCESAPPAAIHKHTDFQCPMLRNSGARKFMLPTPLVEDPRIMESDTSLGPPTLNGQSSPSNAKWQNAMARNLRKASKRESDLQLVTYYSESSGFPALCSPAQGRNTMTQPEGSHWNKAPPPFSKYTCTHPSCTEDPFSAPTIYDLLSHIRNDHNVEDNLFQEYVPCLYRINSRQFISRSLLQDPQQSIFGGPYGLSSYPTSLEG